MITLTREIVKYFYIKIGDQMKKTDKIRWQTQVGKTMFMILERVGKKYNYYVFDRGNAVSAIVYITDLDKIILVKQYRAGSDRFEIEIPAGMRDGDEAAEDTVVREILEETGYAVDKIEHVKHLLMSPGGITEEHDVFYVETNSNLKVQKGGGLVEEHEEIEIMYVSKAEAVAMTNRGEIEDAKAVVALQWMEKNKM